MMLAGIPGGDATCSRSLACSGSRFEDTAERLEDAYDVETKVLALWITEREQILRVSTTRLRAD